MSELTAGTLLQGGKYKIEKSLGQGGFGITYLAEQTNLGRKVCIKEFFMKEYGDRVASDDTLATVLTSVASITSTAAQVLGRYREKFIKEAKTIARLNHPGIVRIHDVFEENETAYYVMDFVEGENLNDLVRREGPLPEDRALGYIRQVADALSYVHGQNIMHLDVKPSNILVDKLNDKTVLIDFGTAKQYDSEGTQTSTTPNAQSAGYTPIELMKAGGLKTFSPETDVYSLGATLYYLVTGQNPPDASDVLEDGLPAMPEHLSLSIRNAVKAAMSKRKLRPKSAADFIGLMYDGGGKEEVKEEKKITPPPVVPSPAPMSKAFYLPYLDEEGCLKNFLTISEANRLQPELEKASAKGDDYATLLLAAMKSRISQKEEAIRMITPLERSADKKVAIRALMDHMNYTDSAAQREHLFEAISSTSIMDTDCLEEAELYLAFSVTDSTLTESEKTHYRKILEKLAGSSRKNISEGARYALVIDAVGTGNSEKAEEHASKITGGFRKLVDGLMGYVKFPASQSELEKERAYIKVCSTAQFLESIFGGDYGYIFGCAGAIATEMGKTSDAFKYFSLGAERNDGPSMARLGMMYLEGGEGTSRNADEALRWLQLAQAEGEDVEQALKIAHSIMENKLYVGFGEHHFTGENEDIIFNGQIIVSDFSLVKKDDEVYLNIFHKSGKAVDFSVRWNLLYNLTSRQLYCPVVCNINFSDTKLKHSAAGRIDLEFRLFRVRYEHQNLLQNKLLQNKLFFHRTSNYELIASFPVSVQHIHHTLKKDEWYIIDE